MSELKLGLIGCGRVVERFHLPALEGLDSWTIVAAADPEPGRLAWIGAELPAVTRFAAVEEMLDRVDLDAVLIATPPHELAAAAEKALADGVHVLLEKPGAKSRVEAERLAQAAAEAAGNLRMGFNRRFMPNYRRLRQGLISGLGSRPFTGEYTLSVNQDAWGALKDLRETDRLEALLLDLVPHQLDAIGWLFADEVVALRLSEGRVGEQGAEIRFDVHFEAGGRLACRARHAEGYEEVMRIEWTDSVAALYPTGTVFGPLLTSPHLVRALTWLDRKRIRLGLKPNVMAHSFRAQWQEFAREMRNQPGASRLAGPDDLVRVHAWLEALRKPAAEATGTASGANRRSHDDRQP